MHADPPKITLVSRRLIRAARALRDGVDELSFGSPVSHVYNPLRYAWAPHELFIRRFGNKRKQVLFLGMNPGPFGMAQTGIPFGEVAAVRDWMGIRAPVEKPAKESKSGRLKDLTARGRRSADGGCGVCLPAGSTHRTRSLKITSW